jgi:hypothetical protein
MWEGDDTGPTRRFKMLMSDQAPYFNVCPRCGSGSLEALATHQHCINCNYFEVADFVDSYDYTLEQLSKSKAKTKPQQNNKNRNKEAAY